MTVYTTAIRFTRLSRLRMCTEKGKKRYKHQAVLKEQEWVWLEVGTGGVKVDSFRGGQRGPSDMQGQRLYSLREDPLRNIPNRVGIGASLDSRTENAGVKRWMGGECG